MDLLAITAERLAHYPGDRLVLAISGGRDSMVLLDVVASLRPPEQLVVAHFDHRLRGTESDRDRALVAERAAARALRFVAGQGSGCRAEDACRTERHAFLETVLRDEQALAIVTAHHAGDQLETLLMRLVRGTGLDGLAGIAPERDRWLRPWLEVPPGVLEAFAASRPVLYREDATNREDAYLRNRVRHRVLPALLELAGEFGGEEPFYRRFSALVGEVAAHVRARRSDNAARFAALFRETPFWLCVGLADWAPLADGDRAELLRLALTRLQAPTPSRERLEALLAEIARGARRIDLGGGATGTLSCGTLYLRSRSQRARLAEPLGFSRTAEGFECGALRMTVAVAADSAAALECRFFRPGDRYRGRKLKRLLLEARVPEPERRLVPVLARPGTPEVLWFPSAETGSGPLAGIRLQIPDLPLSFLRPA